MQWTKDKPSEDGFYWYRFSDGIAEPVLIQTRFDNRLMIDFSSQRSDPEMMSGYWYGPITPPPFEVEREVNQE